MNEWLEIRFILWEAGPTFRNCFKWTTLPKRTMLHTVQYSTYSCHYMEARNCHVFLTIVQMFRIWWDHQDDLMFGVVVRFICSFALFVKQDRKARLGRIRFSFERRKKSRCLRTKSYSGIEYLTEERIVSSPITKPSHYTSMHAAWERHVTSRRFDHPCQMGTAQIESFRTSAYCFRTSKE
jgi:hypothetical protein